VPHAVALAEFVALQRAAVRGLAALATHPAARCLVVDHCLSELVALAVGLQPPNPAPSARPPQTVAAARNESVSESVSEGVSEGERALPLPGQLLVRSSSLVYMPPATPAAARAHLLLGEPELRAEALGCLVRLGFEGGARDLELCFNDAKVRFTRHRRFMAFMAPTASLFSVCRSLNLPAVGRVVSPPPQPAAPSRCALGSRRSRCRDLGQWGCRRRQR
jgi:hypothetical protein